MNVEIFQMILLFLGLLIIIFALFKTKDESVMEEQVEKVLEDFLAQIELENDELLKKISRNQNDITMELEKKISDLDKQIKNIKDNYQTKVSTSKELPKLNPKYAEVYSLFKSGKNIDEIASKTKIGHGEIELIIELLKKGYHQYV